MKSSGHLFSGTLLLLILMDVAFASPDQATAWQGLVHPLKANETARLLITPAPGSIIRDRSGTEMIYVPSGYFDMGITDEVVERLCTEDLKDISHDECVDALSWDTSPSQHIYVKSFWIDRYEVTIEQYEPCTEIEDSHFRSCRKIVPDAQLSQNTQQPQYDVDWYDAMFFCNKRDARLPLEEEWEYAARGPNNLLFPWGNSFIQANVVPSDQVYPTDNTYPVGTIPGNRSWIGVYDLAGNVQEWVENRYTPPLSHPVDLQGSAFDVLRIIRGGSWGDSSFRFLSYRRMVHSPSAASDYVGFRCVRTSPPDGS
jgi:formylglycine-generating enzyme required for sulfatase activity